MSERSNNILHDGAAPVGGVASDRGIVTVGQHFFQIQEFFSNLLVSPKGFEHGKPASIAVRQVGHMMGVVSIRFATLVAVWRRLDSHAS